jgi:hypothetical protein
MVLLVGLLRLPEFLIDGAGDVGQHASPNHFVPLWLIELRESWIELRLLLELVETRRCITTHSYLPPQLTPEFRVRVGKRSSAAKRACRK